MSAYVSNRRSRKLTICHPYVRGWHTICCAYQFFLLSSVHPISFLFIPTIRMAFRRSFEIFSKVHHILKVPYQHNVKYICLVSDNWHWNTYYTKGAGEVEKKQTMKRSRKPFGYRHTCYNVDFLPYYSTIHRHTYTTDTIVSVTNSWQCSAFYYSHALIFQSTAIHMYGNPHFPAFYSPSLNVDPP